VNTGVPRIVTISCTDSDDARWRRRLAQGRHHGLILETMRHVAPRLRHTTLRAWRKLRPTEKAAHLKTADLGGSLLAVLTRATMAHVN